jgi:ribosomal protein L21E
MNTTLFIIGFLFFFIMALVGVYMKGYENGEKKHITLKNGDCIKITYLPSCKNGMGTQNPYIGMQGIVHDFNGETFSIFTGYSWLVNIGIKNCKYENISNTSAGSNHRVFIGNL